MSDSPINTALAEVLKPAATEVGSVLGRSVKAALAPLRGCLWGWEKLEQWIEQTMEEKLRDVPPDRIVSPNPTVSVPALMALSYSMEQESLRTMYANLLARSMDKLTAARVHPSFVEVVKQLTPDEARLVGYLASVEEVIFYDVYYQAIGMSDFAAERVGVTDLFSRALCENTDDESQDVAVSSVVRLGLALFEPRERPQPPSLLSKVEILGPYYSRVAARPGGSSMTALRALRLTAFGRSFCQCCIW